MQSVKGLICLLLVCSWLYGCSSQPVVTDKPVTDEKAAAAAKASQIDPKAEADFKQALSFIKQGQTDQAISLLTDMTSRYPKLSGSQTNLGLIYLEREDLDKAEKALRKAIEIKPDNAVAHAHLGIVLRKRGQFADAEKAYQAALSNNADYALAHLNLGILYDLYLRKFSEALQHYQRYQSLQATEDATVTKWIVGLQRRIKQSK